MPGEFAPNSAKITDDAPSEWDLLAEEYADAPSFEKIQSSTDPKAHERKQRDINNANYAHKREMSDERKREDIMSTQARNSRKNKAFLPTMAESEKLRQEHETIRLSPEEKLERSLNKVNFRLNKHLQDYYVEGAIDSLSDGQLAINPRGFITDGFMEAEKSSIEPDVPAEYDESFWDYVQNDIDNRVSDWNTMENLRAAEKDALITATARGAKLENSSLEEPARLKLMLPIEKYGDGPLQSFMAEYDASPESQEVQLASYDGFINIVEAIKDEDSLTKEGFQALDWYFDNFQYAKHMDEFTDNINAYQQLADASFNKTMDEYLAHRQEVSEYEKQQEEGADSEISALARNAEEVFDFESLFSDDLVDMFPEKDLNRAGDGKISKVERAKLLARSEKRRKALEEVKHILEFDPTATIMASVSDTEKVEDSKYAIVRFLKNDMNNVIAIPIGKSANAMFCWRGEATDDLDSWRKFFEKGSIRKRDRNLVRRFICSGYSKEGHVALDREWGRVWRYLDSPADEKESKSA